jgi:mercuric ion binding protein
MKTIGLITAALVVTVAIVAVRSRAPERRQERDVVAQAVSVDSQIVTLKIPKMDCAGCEVGVRIAAGKVDGVKGVKTDSDTRTAEVTFDPSKTTAQAIASAITKGTGFDTEVPQSAKSKT